MIVGETELAIFSIFPPNETQLANLTVIPPSANFNLHGRCPNQWELRDERGCPLPHKNTDVFAGGIYCVFDDRESSLRLKRENVTKPEFIMLQRWTEAPTRAVVPADGIATTFDALHEEGYIWGDQIWLTVFS
ncbi:MAG: hypothetical protein MMC33_002074 [Icmadophila ericetorum]|nr:hypothetical protein [Icmadophila ericetorum]